jgi:hypothetical protein
MYLKKTVHVTCTRMYHMYSHVPGPPSRPLCMYPVHAACTRFLRPVHGVHAGTWGLVHAGTCDMYLFLPVHAKTCGYMRFSAIFTCTRMYRPHVPRYMWYMWVHVTCTSFLRYMRHVPEFWAVHATSRIRNLDFRRHSTTQMHIFIGICLARLGYAHPAAHARSVLAGQLQTDGTYWISILWGIYHHATMSIYHDSAGQANNTLKRDRSISRMPPSRISRLWGI